jgi:hypothetical protein
MFIENVQRIAMLFAPVAHLLKGLSLETLLTLKVERSLICLVGTQRPTVSIREQVNNVFENINKK